MSHNEQSGGNFDRFQELAALHAAGALDAADAAEFARLLAQADAPARAEAAAFNDAAGLLAGSSIESKTPPASLKSRLMARIARPPGGSPSRPPPVIPFQNVLRDEGDWQVLPVPGVRVKHLSHDRQRGYSVKLYELAPGTRFPAHPHSGDEQCFVLSGDFHVEGRVLHGGDFHHAEAGSHHGESHTEGGCCLLVVAPEEDYG